MRKFAYPDQQQAYVQGLADGVNEHAEMGAKIERERIIALLEEHGAVGYAEEMTHSALIALIKGENE